MSKKILWAVDGSVVTQACLAWVENLSVAMQAEVIVLNAYLLPFSASSFYNMEAQYTAEVNRQYQDQQHKLVDDLVADLQNKGLKASALVIHGDPREMILAEAQKIQADLIVLGRRGLSAWQGLLLGSVSQHVSQHADIPVLLIPTGVQSEL
jgi:nucleotide-binding universal stress UspA family protein